MNYVEETIKALKGLGVTVVDAEPHDLTVPMFEVVCCPIPFEPNEATAMQEVIKCVAQYVRSVEDRAPNAHVIIGPNVVKRDRPTVAITMGVYSPTDYGYLVVGPKGGDLQEIRKV